MGLALWIVPSSTESPKLSNFTRRFRDRCQAQNEQSYPKFDPHVTLALISIHVPLERIRSAIPQGQAPIKVNFASVEIGNHYFRSVYMAVKLTPELETLHDQVHKSLGIDPRTPAYPHLSLCYITDKDAENGERQKFYDGLHLRKDGNGIALDCGDGGGAEDWLSEFITKEIWVVSCEGLVEEWKVLDIVELQS